MKDRRVTVYEMNFRETAEKEARDVLQGLLYYFDTVQTPDYRKIL